MSFRRCASRLVPLTFAAVGLLLVTVGCSKDDDVATPPVSVASTFAPATVGGTAPGSTTRGTRVSTTPTRRPGSTSTPATASTPSTSGGAKASTTAAAGATTTTSDGTAPTTPDGFAQALFEAWRRNDQTAAGAVAEPDAVTALFAQPFPTQDSGDGGTEDFYRFRDCSGAAGSTFCTFVGSDSELQMQVRNQTGGMPMMVIMAKIVDGPAGP